MNRDERIVVVGGGLTGLRAAERLRELKFEGDITILGDEKLPPYHRPALSKQLLQGTLRPSDLTLPAYEDLNARWRFGTQVRQLIPNKKTLVLPGGEEMTYDGLIIATGVEATRQNGVPYHDPRVLVLRTMSDGLDLERVIGSTKGRVAVVGGGFTGCELAASLRHLSREVTLIGRGKNLLGNVLGPDLGEWLTNMHRDHGVDLALGNSVEEWAPGTDGIGLKLTDGSRLTVSCVILAAGTKPMTHWLRGSGLPLDNGVVCEPTCHVVGAEDVVAAGDVAQWPNLRFDNVPRRVEHWLNAVEMGRAAAESLLAGRENAEPFCPMPRFWTDQYSARIQAAGMLKLGKDIVKLGTPDEGTGTVYGFSTEGRLMGVVGVDCPSAMIAWAESVSRQNPEPRRRVPAEQAAEEKVVPITVGGLSKKRPGKHLAPAREKQFQQGTDKPSHEIGFVEHPAEVGGPVGVGAGPVPNGRPKNVVDSFSRMLPVAVRPPHVSGPLPVNGRPAPPPGGRTMPSQPLPLHPSGPLPIPPNHDGASTSGAFPTGTHAPANGFGNGFAGGPTGSGIGSPASTGGFPAAGRPANGTNGTRRNVMRVNGVPASGFGIGRSSGPNSRPRNGVPASPFGTQTNNRPALGPGTGRSTPQHVTPPEFSAAEMTDVGGLPEPLSGRLGPNSGLAIDVTGQMALLDANGHVRKPEFSDPPVRRGPSDSVSGMPPVRRGASDSFSALPPARGPESSFTNMPPARGPESSFANMPAVRGPESSFANMPAAELSSGGMPPVRRPGPQDSHRALPPARRGPEESFGAMPPVRRGASDSFSALPAARRGPEDSFESMPPARRSAPSAPVSRRGPEDSFSGMPPARRGVQDSFSALPPARRASEDSFDAMPPARRGAQDSFSALPPASPRDAETSVSAMPPVRRGVQPPAGPRDAETSVDSMPPVRRGASDSYSALPPARSASGRRRAADDDAYSTMPQTNRRAAHRAEDLTPEFGRPPKRRRDAGSDAGGARMVPAMSSVDDSIEMPPVRMPKHGRPEDYGVPSARGGPEDSYDHIPAVERPRSAGGRRRARA
jgi:NADPH-dependent 2,4-dienoyl-CoA reductase/sulfur reductase-like enzyme